MNLRSLFGKFFAPSDRYGLPYNFLRTAFQTGTGLYKQDNKSIEEFGPLFLAQIALDTFHPESAKLLKNLPSPRHNHTGYYLNDQGGLLIHSNFENPGLFGADIKSGFFFIGRTNIVEHGDAPVLRLTPYFSMLGRYQDNSLSVESVHVLSQMHEDNAKNAAAEYDRVDIGSEPAIVSALYYADLCFHQVLSGAEVTPVQNYCTASQASLSELQNRLSDQLNRSYGSLMAHLTLAENKPLSSIGNQPS